jgi:hypothetical protein
LNYVENMGETTLMIEFILSQPTWIGCGVSMVTAAVVGLVVYVVSYKLISKYQSQDLKDPTSSLFRLVGLLVSLVLALAFSEVIGELKTIRKAVGRETAAISDIFEGLKLFDIERTREIRTILVDYTQAVIDDDWPALANDKLGQRAGALKRQLAEAVINLKPNTPTQEMLLSTILADIDLLSDHRFIRLGSALVEPPVYLYVIIFGFLVTMACFGAYRPQAPLVVLFSLYTLFVGLVLYLVLALSDPFQGDIAVSPAAFEYLVETMQSEIR